MSKLTDKQQLFIELLFDANVKDQDEAKDLAGYGKSTTVAAILKAKGVAEEVLIRTEQQTASLAPEAVKALLNILRNPNTRGAPNAISAAKEILDRGGLIKKDKLEATKVDITAKIYLPTLNEE